MNASTRRPRRRIASAPARRRHDRIHEQFITFTLDAQEYGVDIMRVREIKGWTETTALPQAPSYVRGVINLRGIIVPILDLRARFGMGATEPTRMHVVIIVITGTRTTGLLVDAVSDIISVEPETIRPVPQMDTADRGKLPRRPRRAGRPDGHAGVARRPDRPR